MAKSEPTVTPGQAGPAGHVDKGLKPNAIGFWDGLAIGLDSTAPAYSLAAVLGSLVAIAGTQAPAIMLVSFVPIFLIAGAFFYMNHADQDCGTTFSWVTRAMGPTLGWLGGWAVFTTGVLVIGSLADVAALYTFELFGLTTLSESRPAVVIFAVVIILVMTWLCVIGTELSAKVQRVMVLAQVAILLIFVVVALVRLASGNAPEGAVTPELGWLSPVGLDSTSLISGVLLAVFIYWGWESAVNLTEESTNSATSPGKAGLVSTLILLVTYVGVAIAMIAVVGPELVVEYDDDTALFGAVGEIVLGPLAFLLILAIITSGLASTQTTILPASRTSLSMAVAGAFPKPFAKVHPKFGTPAFGTWVIGIASIVWYVAASLVLGELPLRLPVRAVAADRVLLRADRYRLRHLLAAPADSTQSSRSCSSVSVRSWGRWSCCTCWCSRSSNWPTRRSPTPEPRSSGSASRWRSPCSSSSSASC